MITDELQILRREPIQSMADYGNDMHEGEDFDPFGSVIVALIWSFIDDKSAGVLWPASTASAMHWFESHH